MAEARFKKCPTCGLVQNAGNLDCLQCMTSLESAPALGREAPGLPPGAPEASSGAPGADGPASPADGAASPQGRAAVQAVLPGQATRDDANVIVFKADRGIIRARSGDELGRDCVGGEFLRDCLTVSRRHARVTFDGAKWLIEDLGSSNGIFKGGVRVASAVLEAGDTVTLSTACELFVSKC
ncbi:MAG: FHA domain-containing protein [Deltaproteobacteria bacterium]|jgi:hypothetical protein|nr:FHA domain-containing protein [Deltaproteobacteria bacterium]